jgi:thioredoxin-like negative regulator of GroEL
VSARSTSVRALLAVLAAAAVAWFVLLGVQSHATDAATSLSGRPHLTAAQAHHADSLLDTAGVLYPGQEAVVLRAKVAFANGDVTRARRLAAQAAYAEPGNPDAWLELVDVSHGTPVLASAFRHLVSLVPAVH